MSYWDGKSYVALYLKIKNGKNKILFKTMVFESYDATIEENREPIEILKLLFINFIKREKGEV